MGVRRVREKICMGISVLKLFIVLLFIVNLSGCVQNKSENSSTNVKEYTTYNNQDASNSQEEVNIASIEEILVSGIKNNLLKDFVLPEGKEVLCVYEGLHESDDKRIEGYYSFCIYKEIKEKGIFYQDTLLISCKEGEIYTSIVSGASSKLKLIGSLKEIRSHLKDEDLANKKEDRPESISQEEALDGIYEIMVRESGIDSIELMLEPENDFLGRAYYCAAVVDSSDWKVTRGKRIYVDKYTREVYWLLEDEEALRDELWYMGTIKNN